MGIRTWVQGHAADVEEGNAGYLASELAAALRPPMPGQGPQYTSVFIVMQAKQNLTDLESEGLKGMGRDADGTITVRDKTGVKALHQVFKQPGVLEKLGEIVAADAFNGNQDRVNFNGTGKKWDGQMLLCLQNPGNIFVGDGGGALTVLGLDVFDPYGSFKDWGTLNEGAEAYPGRILRTDAGAKRLELARKLAADIERILGPRNRTFAFQKTDSPAGRRGRTHQPRARDRRGQGTGFHEAEVCRRQDTHRDSAAIEGLRLVDPAAVSEGLGMVGPLLNGGRGTAGRRICRPVSVRTAVYRAGKGSSRNLIAGLRAPSYNQRFSVL